MQIKGKSIRTVTKLLAASKGCEEIKLVHKVTIELKSSLLSIGFDADPDIGDFLIPKPVGKATALNAHGKEIIRKDLPLEPQPVSSFRTWKDWHGQEHSGIQTREIDKYPREYQPAHEELLYIIAVDGEKYVTTDSLNLESVNELRNIHLSNLMLESFGSFEVLDAKSGGIIGAKIKQLHWDILPSGEYPWSRAKPLVEKITKNLNDSKKGVIESRMKTITQYTPDFLATGRAGFSGYFVYGFAAKEIYILESVHFTAVPLTFTTTRIGLGCSFDGERHRLELRPLGLVFRTG
jgi:hypothetical protein